MLSINAKDVYVRFASNVEKLNEINLKELKRECIKARDQYLSKIQRSFNSELEYRGKKSASSDSEFGSGLITFDKSFQKLKPGSYQGFSQPPIFWQQPKEVEKVEKVIQTCNYTPD